MVVTASDVNHFTEQERQLNLRLLSENDTFCLLPANLRCFCLLLTILLMVSLAAAIGNSMQASQKLSASHCKENIYEPGVGILCPKESMFMYYSCCRLKSHKPKICCPQVKIWLLVAMIGVISSLFVAICFWLIRYITSMCRRCLY